MTFTEAQEAARTAFAQNRTPGLDAVAHVLQRAVTNEQNRLATEVAKVEGRCTDLENKTKRLEAENAALRAQLEDAQMEASQATEGYEYERQARILAMQQRDDRRAQADKLAAALEIYASPDNWRQKDTRTGAFDWFLRGNAGWDIADKALDTARGA